MHYEINRETIWLQTMGSNDQFIKQLTEWTFESIKCENKSRGNCETSIKLIASLKKLGPSSFLSHKEKYVHSWYDMLTHLCEGISANFLNFRSIHLKFNIRFKTKYIAFQTFIYSSVEFCFRWSDLKIC